MKNVQIIIVLVGCIFLLIGLMTNKQIGISFLVIGLAMLLFGIIKETKRK
ncbi:hypothetical protein [Mammaliicoccus vitulinus]|nr:hypothetical protein [Mammaliicoccus vitulinus]